MEHYVSDEEQVEAIKRWWKANGGAIVAGIVIGLTAILGWQYWTSYRAEQATAASNHYEILSRAVAEKSVDSARRAKDMLVDDYASTLYAPLGMLQLAKLEVEEGNNSMAIDHLNWVVENAKQDEIKDIARLRLARLLLAEERLEEAEVQLGEISNESFTGEREELLGDLYLARNQPEQALTAYQTALAAGSGSTLLQMKLDNLAVLSADGEG